MFRIHRILIIFRTENFKNFDYLKMFEHFEIYENFEIFENFEKIWSMKNFEVWKILKYEK